MLHLYTLQVQADERQFFFEARSGSDNAKRNAL